MRKRISAAGAVLAVFLLVGCGGGGGGSSSPYTGLTTPAMIDDTNAVDIAQGAYYGGEMVDTSFMPVVMGDGEKSRSVMPPPVNVIGLVRTLQEVTESLGGQSQPSRVMGQARPLDVWDASGRIPDGATDNYVDFSFSWNDLTGVLSGTFSFHNYGDGEGGVLNGTVSVRATASILPNPDPQPGEPALLPGEILDFTIGFSSFIATDGINTVEISGSMTLVNDAQTGNGTATMFLYVTEQATGMMSRIDYEVTTTGGVDGIGTYTDLTISNGSDICLHDYGCVEVETTTPFRQYDIYLFPSSGVLVVTGDAGRSARFNVISETLGYNVDADLDANGTYEWHSDVFPWV